MEYPPVKPRYDHRGERVGVGFGDADGEGDLCQVRAGHQQPRRLELKRTKAWYVNGKISWNPDGKWVYL